MNHAELNSILYYADFLSLKAISQPVTDNCKYFFIFGCPINSAYILGLEPIYDPQNQYIIQAYQEYNQIKEHYSEEAVESFIDDICFIRSCGMVDARRMLQQIHFFSTKVERKQAFKEYEKWEKSNKYVHQVKDEDGNTIEVECTKFFKHAETAFTKRKLHESTTNA